MAATGLRFGAQQEFSSDAGAAVLFIYPKMRDDTDACPSMAAEATDEFARIGTDAPAQELAIVAARGTGVELVDVFDELCLQLDALSFVQQFNSPWF